MAKVEDCKKDGNERDTDDTVPLLGSTHVYSDPFVERICPFNPREVNPVPPDEIGSGVSEYEISNTPDELIVEVEDFKKGGKDKDTEVTVPVPVTDIHPN